MEIPKNDLAALFALCDAENKGSLNPKELRMALSGVFGFVPVSPQEEEERHKQTSLGQFYALIHAHFSPPTKTLCAERSNDLMRRVFLSLDQRCLGAVERKDLPKSAGVDVLFDDTVESGRMSYAEFGRVLLRNKSV